MAKGGAGMLVSIEASVLVDNNEATDTFGDLVCTVVLGLLDDAPADDEG